MNDIEFDIISGAVLDEGNRRKLFQFDNDIFESYDSKVLFNAMRDMEQEGETICLLSLVTKLESKGELEKIGGQVTIARIGQSYPIINYDYVLNELYKKNIRQKINAISKDIQGSKTDDERLGWIEKLSEEKQNLISKNKTKYVNLDEIIKGEMETIFEKSYFHRTGLKPIDDVILGLFNGQLIVLAARPKKGKSALALQIALNVNKTIFFSLEMKARELYARILSAKTSIPSWKIETCNLTGDEKTRIDNIRNNIKDKYSLKIFDNINDYFDIVNNITKLLEHENKPNLIVIDYLQLIRNAPGDNQNLRIAGITGTMKGLALKYNIPILLISQLSRDSEKQGKREPILSDLRDSGAIEQDADVIIFIHETKEKNTEIIIAGNRKGKEGTIRDIKFIREFTYFEERQSLYQPNYQDVD